MQFVVVICIFIQEHLPSDLLVAEQCQVTVLLLLVSAEVSGWDVQETGRVRLGSSQGKSSQWGCRKKPSHLTQNQGVPACIFHFLERGKEDYERWAKAQVLPRIGSGLGERENLLVAQARARETCLALMRLGFGYNRGAYKPRGIYLFPDGLSAV